MLFLITCIKQTYFQCYLEIAVILEKLLNAHLCTCCFLKDALGETYAEMLSWVGIHIRVEVTAQMFRHSAKCINVFANFQTKWHLFLKKNNRHILS